MNGPARTRKYSSFISKSLKIFIQFERACNGLSSVPLGSRLEDLEFDSHKLAAD